MLNEYQTYKINLEDYSYPRYASVARPYFGTMNDLMNLKYILETNEWTKARYGELIDGIEYYELDWDMSHTVAGREYKLLSPVTELFRQEVRLEEHQWLYRGYSGASYPMYAESVDVDRVLLRLEDDTLCRCVKVVFNGLKICAPGIGWYTPNGATKGFPGTVTCDGSTHMMCMYVCEQFYEPQELVCAMEDMQDTSKIDLAAACQDILGEA